MWALRCQSTQSASAWPSDDGTPARVSCPTRHPCTQQAVVIDRLNGAGRTEQLLNVASAFGGASTNSGAVHGHRQVYQDTVWCGTYWVRNLPIAVAICSAWVSRAK
jgi:hypothetical protein